MLKNGKSVNRNEHQNRETEVFWHKNRKTDLKNSQNRKTENPNAPLVIQSIKRCLYDSECHFTFRYRNALLKYSAIFFFNTAWQESKTDQTQANLDLCFVSSL